MNCILGTWPQALGWVLCPAPHVVEVPVPLCLFLRKIMIFPMHGFSSFLIFQTCWKVPKITPKQLLSQLDTCQSLVGSSSSFLPSQLLVRCLPLPPRFDWFLYLFLINWAFQAQLKPHTSIPLPPLSSPPPRGGGERCLYSECVSASHITPYK